MNYISITLLLLGAYLCYQALSGVAPLQVYRLEFKNNNKWQKFITCLFWCVWAAMDLAKHIKTLAKPYIQKIKAILGR